MSIHDLMKNPERIIKSRIRIEYTTPDIDNFTASTNDTNDTIGTEEQLYDGLVGAPFKAFTLAENDLTGDYKVYDNNVNALGWWSQSISEPDNTFSTPIVITLDFDARTIRNPVLIGDYTFSRYPVDFTYQVFDASAVELFNYHETSNDQIEWSYEAEILDAAQIVITINSINVPGKQLILQEVYNELAETYEDDILSSVTIYEETSFDNDFALLGKVSANSLEITLSNEDQRFSPNNTDSPLQGALKKNRKTQAFFGVYDPDAGEVVWYPWGVFWVNKWNVKRSSLEASMYALDTLDFLYQMPFANASIYYDETIDVIIRDIFNAAGLNTTDYNISATAAAISLPFVYFTQKYCREALQYLVESLLLNVFCDHSGVIQVKHFSEVNVVATNLNDTEDYYDIDYPSPLENFYNIVEVNYYSRTLVVAQEVFNQIFNDSIAAGETKTYLCLFSNTPCENIQEAVIVGTNLSVVAQTDSVFGTSVQITNTGTQAETLESISVEADYYTVQKISSVVLRNEDSIADDGEIAAPVVDHPFIQTEAYASTICQYLFDFYSVTENNIKLDARGNIGLNLLDKIEVIDTKGNTASSYVVSKQQLTWSGPLSADIELKKEGG